MGMPDLGGAVGWLNSGALSAKSLRGKIVLIDFWTYTCINSIRAMPYVKSWAAKYKDAGRAVVGVHTPEFSFEHELSNEDQETENEIMDVKDSKRRLQWATCLTSNHYGPSGELVCRSTTRDESLRSVTIRNLCAGNPTAASPGRASTLRGPTVWTIPAPSGFALKIASDSRVP